MSKIYTIIFLFFLSFSVIQAQDVTFEHEVITGSLYSADDQGGEYPETVMNISNKITNNSGDRININWERITNDLPEGWTSAICFGDVCLIETISSGDQEIDAGETLDFKLQINTNGASLAGAGNVVIEIRDVTNALLASSSFVPEVFATSIEEVPNLEQEVSIYPNPVRDVLNLDFYNYENIEVVEIYNMLGKVVERVVIENTNETKKIDLSSLSEGMFFLSLIDNNNQLVETKRFSKVR